MCVFRWYSLSFYNAYNEWFFFSLVVSNTRKTKTMKKEVMISVYAMWSKLNSMNVVLLFFKLMGFYDNDHDHPHKCIALSPIVHILHHNTCHAHLIRRTTHKKRKIIIEQFITWDCWIHMLVEINKIKTLRKMWFFFDRMHFNNLADGKCDFSPSRRFLT